MSRRALLALAFIFTTLALTLLITGGFATSVVGIRVSARSPGPATAAALISLVTWFVLAWRARAVGDDLAGIDAWIASRATAVIVVIAGVAGAIAILFNSYSAGGADASGYLSQTVMLLEGRLSRVEPLITIADWTDAATTLAPLGWRAGTAPGVQVPTYAVGLPLLMTGPYAIGGLIAASLIVSMSLIVAVMAVGLIARRLAGPLAGIVAALWLATSPVALIESMQPMSDVPVTAAWIICWLLLINSAKPDSSAALAAGVAAAMAVLIRPNLAPLAAVPFLYLAAQRQYRDAFIFAVPVALSGIVVAYLQWRYFGSPLRSGYGSAGEIYALANVAPNAALYMRWLLETHGPWLLAAPIAAWWPIASRRVMQWLLAFAALVVIGYLLYSIFETWTYLRFLLPAIAIATIAVSTVLAALCERLPISARVPTIAVIVLALFAINVASAARLGVFRFAGQQSRASLSGRYLESALPQNAVVIAGEQSGAVRYYSNRSIVRWDFLDPQSLDAVIARVKSAGYQPWITLDTWEEELFRTKFRGSTAGALDWPPTVDAGTEPRTRAWRLRDRDRYIGGERVTVDRLR